MKPWEVQYDTGTSQQVPQETPQGMPDIPGSGDYFERNPAVAIQEMTKRGILKSVGGIPQMALEGAEAVGLTEPKTLEDYNQRVQQLLAEYKSRGGKLPYAGGAEMAGATLPWLAVGGPKGGGLMKNIGIGAGMGAGIGASQFAEKEGDRGFNTVVGGIIGGGIPVAVWTTSKFANAVKEQYGDQAVQALQDLSKRFGVRTSYGDIKGGAVVPKIETATEAVPVAGMGGFREAQQKEAKAAAAGLREKFGSRLKEGEDWTDLVQGSLKKKSEVVNKISKKNYTKVSSLADPKGPVPLNNTVAKAQELINEQKALGEHADQAVISELEKFTKDPGLKFSQLQGLRSNLSDDIAAGFSGGKMDLKGTRALRQLKDAMNTDMKDFAMNSGDANLKIAWNQADKYHRTKVVPLRDKALTKAARTDTPDEIYQQFIKSGKRDRARKFYNSLDNTGRDAVRYGMVDDAYQAAIRDDGVFSPATFASKMTKNQAAANVFFKGADKREIDGFVKLMQHVKRAGEYAENPPTGQRVIAATALGGSMATPAAPIIAKIMAGTYGIKTLFTSKAGKRLLLAAAQSTPGTPAMNKLVQELTQMENE